MTPLVAAFADGIVKHGIDPLTFAMIDAVGGPLVVAALLPPMVAGAAADAAIRQKLRGTVRPIEKYLAPVVGGLGAGALTGSAGTGLGAMLSSVAMGGLAARGGGAIGRALATKRYPHLPYVGEVGYGKLSRPARIVGQLLGAGGFVALRRLLSKSPPADTGSEEKTAGILQVLRRAILSGHLALAPGANVARGAEGALKATHGLPHRAPVKWPLPKRPLDRTAEAWARELETERIAKGRALPAGPDPPGLPKHANDPIQRRITVQGLPISIEWPKGSTRKYFSKKDPKKCTFAKKMSAHYGYIPGTKDADGEQLDVYVGPNTGSKAVFIIKQLKYDGSFDEHKVMLGCETAEEAKAVYLAHMPRKLLGKIETTDMATFKKDHLVMAREKAHEKAASARQEMAKILSRYRDTRRLAGAEGVQMPAVSQAVEYAFGKEVTRKGGRGIAKVLSGNTPFVTSRGNQAGRDILSENGVRSNLSDVRRATKMLGERGIDSWRAGDDIMVDALRRAGTINGKVAIASPVARGFADEMMKAAGVFSKRNPLWGVLPMKGRSLLAEALTASSSSWDDDVIANPIGGMRSARVSGMDRGSLILMPGNAREQLIKRVEDALAAARRKGGAMEGGGAFGAESPAQPVMLREYRKSMDRASALQSTVNALRDGEDVSVPEVLLQEKKASLPHTMRGFANEIMKLAEYLAPFTPNPKASAEDNDFDQLIHSAYDGDGPSRRMTAYRPVQRALYTSIAKAAPPKPQVFTPPDPIKADLPVPKYSVIPRVPANG